MSGIPNSVPCLTYMRGIFVQDEPGLRSFLSGQIGSIKKTKCVIAVLCWRSVSQASVTNRCYSELFGLSNSAVPSCVGVCVCANHGGKLAATVPAKEWSDPLLELLHLGSRSSQQCEEESDDQGMSSGLGGLWVSSSGVDRKMFGEYTIGKKSLLLLRGWQLHAK